MNYWQYTLHTAVEADNELLIALLADAPFDTFEEEGTTVHAYLPDQDGHTDEAEALLSDLGAQFSFTWEKTFIEGQNWNEIWESNFHPVIVEDWCAVRADFHEPIGGVQHELVINPKMAFGTGHHETTWMCLAAMQHLPIEGRHLFDYGCGTGILAILAARLGAKSVEAIDIETESYENTVNNCAINEVTNVTARCGDISVAQDAPYEGIFANINRHIILDSLLQLAQMTQAGGWLLLSGILIQDGDLVIEAATAVGFQHVQTNSRGNWLCVEMRK
jgi:ribosomal protein L11 methyltransferase